MTDTNFRKAETLLSALKIQHSKEGSNKQTSKQAKEATTETTCHLS
jgi:hypothetical protein